MRKKKSAILEYAVYLFIIIFVLFLAPRFIMEKILIDGSSMENSLSDGEHVLIEKVSRYFNGPERFEIVVFTKTHGTYEKTYVKRVIGLPGETVRIEENRIYINGEVLEENFGKDPMENAGIAANEITLGEDEYFVLGDNRIISMDSRNAAVGVVKKEELVGVVFLRVSPWSAFGTVE